MKLPFEAARPALMAMIALAICLGLPKTAQAQLFESQAPYALLIDHETGSVLYSKNADEPVPPASLTKLVTMEILFNALKNGSVALDSTMQVSENAWRTGGAQSGSSAMFLEPREEVAVSDLMRGVIVQSGNDATIVIAENLAGTESNFALQMNDRARQLGLTSSHFENASGLPAEGQVVTMRDLVKLARHIYTDYPEYYSIYSEEQFTWSGITQRNRNPLLGGNLGVDGMKTGYIEDSGYALVASAKRDDRRLFLAISGLESVQDRESEARKLIQFGFGAFEKRDLFESGAPVAEVALFGGEIDRLPVVAKEPLSVLVPRGNQQALRADVVYDGPIRAPVEEGTQVGFLEVFVGETLSRRTPLYAARTVGTGALHQRAMDAFEELTLGWLRG